MFHVIYIHAPVLFIFTSVYSTEIRFKRVISGVVVEGRDTGYDAVRYYAAIGTRHSAGWFGYYGDLGCSGALITPKIVQTACHCLAWMSKAKRKDDALVYAEAMHAWESNRVVYVGVNSEFADTWSMITVDPLLVKRFIIDQRCAQLPKGAIKLATHDYGWMLIDNFLAPSNSKLFNRVNFAPVYTLEEIKQQWEYLMRIKSVCLHIGFGSPIRGIHHVARRDLRHGWTMMLTYDKCVSLLNKSLDSVGGRSLMSWLCTVPFHRHDESTSKGDSGGPITCNNLYFAIVMGGFEAPLPTTRPDPEVKTVLDLDSPIAFATYQNAAQYRAAFMDYASNKGLIPFDQILRRRKSRLDPNPTFNPFAGRIRYTVYTPTTREPEPFNRSKPTPKNCKGCKAILVSFLLGIFLYHY